MMLSTVGSIMPQTMKVTVCFDQVRVVVPCGCGDLTVATLIELALARYRKAIGKANDYWVTVHSLKSLDGGILDHDDRLIDVVDDREQIVAIYEEQDGRKQQHNGGDGTSASSVGTSSPDIFQGPMSEQHRITKTNLVSRCGSEPMLRKLPDNMPDCVGQFAKMSMDDNNNTNVSAGMPPPPGYWMPQLDSPAAGDAETFQGFARVNSRKSLATNAAMIQWLEAQEKAQDKFEQEAGLHNEKPASVRKEPVGSSDHMVETEEQYPTMIEHFDVDSPAKQEEVGSVIVLENSGGPLGIHVVPGVDSHGRDIGLTIHGIESSGRIYRDGRLRVNDHIVAINGTSLIGADFAKAQEIFRQALQAPKIELQVIFTNLPPATPSHQQPMPAIFRPISGWRKPVPDLPVLTEMSGYEPNTSTPSKDLEVTASAPATAAKVCPSTALKMAPMTGLKPAPMTCSKLAPSTCSKQAPATGSKQLPLMTPSRSLSALNIGGGSLSGSKSKFTPIYGTRAVGRKIHIQLLKGPEGLGFSVTTRDNPAGGNCPIYIKNILAKGAAISDGRLQPGDRLLEVNGIDMAGKSQADVVNYLRNVKFGSVVNLIVSRVELDEELQPASVANSACPASDSVNINTIDNDIYVFLIALGETGTESGLGISVKGKTTVSDSVNRDLGLYVKSVVEGGAAAKDGRLCLDDRLLEVNGVSLLGLTNVDAMETLRQAMQSEGPEPYTISLAVARAKPTTAGLRAPTGPSEATVLDSARKACQLMPPPSTNKVLSCRKPQPSQTPAACEMRPPPDCATRPPSAFRNTSYQRATHENTLGDNSSVASQSPAGNNASHGKGVTSAVSGGGQEARSDNSSVPLASMSAVKSSAGADPDLDDNAPTPKQWRGDWDATQSSAMTFTSPEAEAAFTRDAISRKSMSEKRRKVVDPRIGSFYQQLQQSKGSTANNTTLKRVLSAESLLSQTTISSPKFTRGAAGHVRESLKKCTSLESLKTATAAGGSRLASTGEPLNTGRGRLHSDLLYSNNNNIMAAVVEEESDARIPATDKKKSLFRGLFRFGKKKETKPTSSASKPAATAIPAVRPEPTPVTKGNVRIGRAQPPNDEQDDESDFESEIAEANDQRHRKSAAAARSRSDASDCGRRLRRPNPEHPDIPDATTRPTSRDAGRAQRENYYSCQEPDYEKKFVRPSGGYHAYHEFTGSNLDYPFDSRHEDHCYSHCQNYRDVQQSVRHHRYESYAPPESHPPPPYHRCCNRPYLPESTGPCQCCYDQPTPGRDPSYYGSVYSTGDPYDRLGRYACPPGPVGRTPLLNARHNPYAVDPSMSARRHVVSPPPTRPRAKTPFGEPDDHRGAELVDNWSGRERCYSVFDDPRRAGFPALGAGGLSQPLDQPAQRGGSCLLRRRADTMAFGGSGASLAHI